MTNLSCMPVILILGLFIICLLPGCNDSSDDFSVNSIYNNGNDNDNDDLAEPESDQFIGGDDEMTEEPEESTQTTQDLIVELSLDQLVIFSEYIAVGEITNEESRWNEEETNIYTYYTFKVDKYLKGTHDYEIIIKVLGGRVDSTEQWVEDSPVMMEGKETVVFLEETEGDMFSIVGGVQGVYSQFNGELSLNGLTLPEFIERIESKIK